MTSVTSNMHSLMPYYIKIQAAGLLWNNSVDNSIQEQHHKTKNMFIFCAYPQLYTSVPAPSHKVKMHDNFVRFAPSLSLRVLLYLRASFWFLSQAVLSPSALRPQTKIGPRTLWTNLYDGCQTWHLLTLNLIYIYSGESQNRHTCVCRHTQYLICMYISRVAYL